MNDDNNTNDLEYEVYLESRKSYVESKGKSSEMFDKSILTLAAGALGLSITFINQIVETINPDTLFWLGIAWVGLCLSILSTLISFRTSVESFEKQIKILDDSYPNIPTISNKYITITKALNWVSTASFIVGTGCLAVFSYINL